MISKDYYLVWWLGGLAIFAISIMIHAPLAIEAVPGGILDHQAASNAASVDAIQTAWMKAGLIGQARFAMISDLVFILVYSFGALNAGRYFRAKPNGVLSALGWVAIAAASVFFLTDFTETLLQLFQLQRLEGSDTLAYVASLMGPGKVTSFLASFAVIAVAMMWERLSKVSPE
ncbi:MAG: hypothetical protein AAFW59_06590 [Pseudomonadota bacterium]